MNTCDVAIVGAGAAGLFCAGIAAQQGLSVVLIDHSAKLAEKIRISGGGRSNFTNKDIDPQAPQRHFLGENPLFARSALSRYTAQDFVALVQSHGLAFHEKHKGQLFCDRSSQDLIDLLWQECQRGAQGGSVSLWQPCAMHAVRHHPGQTHAYALDTDRGELQAQALVVATGGLSIPQIGASDLGYRLAKQFDLPMVDTRPGLVPLTFGGEDGAMCAQMAGASLPVHISTGTGKTRMGFDEDLLFTHRGLSGPAVLQISSFWQMGTPIEVDLLPQSSLSQALTEAKLSSRKSIANELAQWLPTRLANAWVARDAAWQRPINQASDRALGDLAQALSSWALRPTGSEGYKKAEVTVGGVSTKALSQKTMESTQKGLYFIGEVVDITGWLGGYNFQWAWSSAHACAVALGAALKPL
jgi:predicted Rossmann fold flavoprotein